MKERTVERADFHLKIVQEISDIVNKTTGLNTILKRIVSKIGRSLNLDVVSVYIWNNEKNELVLRANRGLKINPEKDSITLKPEEGLTGLVFEKHRPIIVMPASRHPRYRYFPEIGEEEYESYIGVPIILNNKSIGVLVGQTKERRFLTPAEETLFEIISARLAGLLEVADTLDRLKTPSIVKHETRTYQGKGVSSGIAIGNAFLFRGLFRQLRDEKIDTLSPDIELERLDKAISDVEDELHTLIETISSDEILSQAEVDIFRAHLLILKSTVLKKTITDILFKNKFSAEHAVIEGIESIAEQFESLEDPYLRERAMDFRDIGERILHDLLKSKNGGTSFAEPETGAILVAHDIGPSIISMLNDKKVSAIVTELGSETSHATIIAKSMGIPAVVGIDEISIIARSGEKLIVDGKTGFVFSNPDDSLIAEYECNFRKLENIKEIIESEKDLLVDNELNGITITANIGFPIDIEIAKQNKIRDVGLFRTEFAFTQFEKWPGVRDQLKIYKKVAQSFDGYITVRTLDIGADKLLPYIDFPQEENPLLGLRAIRFSMEYLDLFKDQIKSILLANKKGCKFRILLPMISNLWEVETAREIVEQIGKEISIAPSDLPEIGIMMEVPAILYQLDDYKDLVDFISIGTNDLIQYILAVDRNSNKVGHLYSGFHPSVIRMLNNVSESTRYFGKEISICGELAGTPSGALALISLGFKFLSVSPSRAPVLRYLCRRLDNGLLGEVKKRILNEKKTQEIQRFIIDTLEGISPSLIEIE